jgi:lipoprotein-anchoring transpeptidase ErfK/SrfK
MMAVLQNRRNQIIAAVVALVAVVGIVAAIALTGGGEPVAAPETTTTTTTSTTLDLGDRYKVASPKGDVLEVQLEAPQGVSPSPLFVVREARTQPIPRSNLNSAGVRVIDGGYAYDNPTYFKNPLIFLVVSEQGEWTELSLPARPNGQTGWARTELLDITEYDARIELDLSTKTLTARLEGEVVVKSPVTIGYDSNPTPTGIYFITEEIPQTWEGGPFGPMIMATSAYSERLELFENGLPVVAVHGTNEPDAIGQKGSNGCIRLPNDVITKLAEAMPPGVPLVITGDEAYPQT